MHVSCLPECVFEATDYDVRYYPILLLILNRPLRVIQVLNPSTILTLFKKGAETRVEAQLRAVNQEHGPNARRFAWVPELLVAADGKFERPRRRRSSEIGRSDAQVKLPHLRTTSLEHGEFSVHSTILMQ